MTTTRLESDISLSSFQIEMLFNIFTYLGPLELLRLEQVSRLYLMCARDQSVWKNIHAVCSELPSSDNKSSIDWRETFITSTYRQSKNVAAANFLFHFYKNNLSDQELRSLTHDHLWTTVNGSYLSNLLMKRASQKLLDRLFLIESRHYSKLSYCYIRRAIVFNIAIECNQRNHVLKEVLQNNYKTFSSLILYQNVSLNKSPLYIASSRGQLDVVMALLHANVVVDPHDEDNTTPLMIAASKGYLLIVRALCTAGADVKKRDSNNLNAIRYAILHEHAHVVRYLIKIKNTIIDPENYYSSTLCFAAKKNKFTMIKILLDEGLNVDYEENELTPLSAASLNGHLESVKMLLNAGANLEGKAPGCIGSPLFAAAQEGHLNVFKELIQRGASIQYQFMRTQSQLEKYASDNNQIEVFNYYIAESLHLHDHSHLNIIITVLDIAVLRKQSNIVVELVKHVKDTSQLTSKLNILTVIAAMNSDLSTLKVFGRMGVNFDYETVTHKQALHSTPAHTQPGKSCLEFMKQSVQQVKRAKQFRLGLYHSYQSLLFSKVASPLLDPIELQTDDNNFMPESICRTETYKTLT